MLAYHFSGSKLRDGWPVPAIGEKLVFQGEPILCEQGLHFSLHPFDALQYAPGPMLHRVRVGGIVVHGEDKGVCTERTIVASVDATAMLRKFACDIALEGLPAHAPDVVRRYLLTQDESLRIAARNAAWGAALEAALEAARNAAREAARDAAWGAARNAAREAALESAWGAAWGAARKRQRDMFLARVEQAFKTQP